MKCKYFANYENSLIYSWLYGLVSAETHKHDKYSLLRPHIHVSGTGQRPESKFKVYRMRNYKHSAHLESRVSATETCRRKMTAHLRLASAMILSPTPATSSGDAVVRWASLISASTKRIFGTASLSRQAAFYWSTRAAGFLKAGGK